MKTLCCRALVFACALGLGATTAWSQPAAAKYLSAEELLRSSRPAAELLPTRSLTQVDLVEAYLPAEADIRMEDEARALDGLAPRFAIAQPVWITPDTDGEWEKLPNGLMLWRLRIGSPGALSINLGFGRYWMPQQARLLVYAADKTNLIRPFTSADNADHGQLWTPVIKGDEIVVELAIAPEQMKELILELTAINPGYRPFGERPSGLRSGACNVDVACPESAGWETEVASVAVISTGGSTFCTGFMVNNVRQDLTPLFMTADHCGISSSNAASLVTYWNYENSTCRPPDSPASGGAGDGVLTQFNTGSTFLAGYGDSDFTLVQLTAQPNPTWEVAYAGWDATGADATSATAVHHPNTDEKRISFEYAPTTTTDYLGTTVPGDGTHVRVEDWDVGTTEPGSSGSPLFNQDHRVIGQLHGGYAACGNDDADWYGKFSVSWDRAGSSPSNRLRDHLDPDNTGTLVVDGISGAGLTVVPGDDVVHFGVVGGPFTNDTVVYTLSNPSPDPVDYQVSLTSSVGILINGDKFPITGTLPASGGQTTVTATLGPDVSFLGAGIYTETILFEDLTNVRSTSRLHTIEIGQTQIAVTPETALYSSGEVGGPFPGTVDYTVTSERPTPVSVEVTADAPWIALNGGTSPLTLNFNTTGESAVVSVSIDASAAAALPAGIYAGAVTFTNLAGGAGSTTRDVTLEAGRIAYPASDVPQPITDNNTITSVISVPNSVCIADVDVDLDVSHTYIGDLTIDLQAPDGTTLRLHNRNGGTTEDIVTTYDEDGGTLPDGPGTLGDFNFRDSAGNWTLTIEDHANQDTGALNAWTLRIAAYGGACPELIMVHSETFDSDPGWSLEGQWAFGQPTGNGGDSGDPDPTSGYTGTNVIGYNLNGDYANDMPATEYATSTPFDCQGITATSVRFRRWLGVESSSYDHVSIQVSNDQSDWVTVWENPGSSISDGEWTLTTFDISDVADNAPTVYLRWGLGTTDGSVRYCGWNIDDVEIWGVLPPPPNWSECMTGPQAGPYLDGCEDKDMDADGDVDLRDFAMMQQL